MNNLQQLLENAPTGLVLVAVLNVIRYFSTENPSHDIFSEFFRVRDAIFDKLMRCEVGRP